MAFIGNTVTTQGFVPAIDYFSGNASTTAFTLSRPVASVAQVQAVISNVPQNPGDAFTVSGNTITFTSAPPTGTNNIYVYYTSPITQTIQPSQGTVGQTQMASPTGTGNPVLQTSPTLTSPTFSGTPTGVGVLTSGTAVNSTSGTSIDFTSIPSWVKRITVMFNGVSTNGTSILQVQLGSGSVTTAGYTSVCGYTYSPGGSITSTATTGFIVIGSTMAATFNINGAIVFTTLGGSVWVEQGVLVSNTGTPVSCASAGQVALSGTLDRVRITTVNGTDTFDAGSINILYE